MNKLFLALLLPALTLGLTAQETPKKEKAAACCQDAKTCGACKDVKACKDACKDKKACEKPAEKKA